LEEDKPEEEQKLLGQTPFSKQYLPYFQRIIVLIFIYGDGIAKGE